MKKTLLIILLISNIIYAEKPFVFQQDKQLHILAGAVISETVYNYTLNKTDNKTEAIIMAVFSTVLVGTIKEAYDSFQPGNKFDLKDLGATCIGASIIIPVSIFDKKKKHIKL